MNPRLLAEAEVVFGFMERREEILAAIQELRRHDEDLDEIADDEECPDDFCLQLFEEECFAPFVSPDELDDWIQAKITDPANAASFEAFLEENPQWRDESAANIQAMERNSMRLLERAGSECLHVSAEEAHPWVTRLSERFNDAGFATPELDGEPSE